MVAAVMVAIVMVAIVMVAAVTAVVAEANNATIAIAIAAAVTTKTG